MRRITLAAALVAAIGAAQADAPERAGGDPLKVEFVLPFARAREQARKSGKLLFVKPIYGGVDAAGAKDYRCGSW